MTTTTKNGTKPATPTLAVVNGRKVGFVQPVVVPLEEIVDDTITLQLKGKKGEPPTFRTEEFVTLVVTEVEGTKWAIGLTVPDAITAKTAAAKLHEERSKGVADGDGGGKFKF